VNLDTLFHLLYMVSAVLFIVGLKFLSHPKRARNGNLVAALGMAVACATTLAMLWAPGAQPPRNLPLIFAAIVIGGGAGAIGARVIAMTDMPQMVALLNGAGGIAAALVAMVEFLHLGHSKAGGDAMFGVVIGSISFWGSVVAWAKLQGVVSERAITSPMLKAVNIALFLGLIGLIGLLGFVGGGAPAFTALFVVASLFGICMVLPIGGADMPVVISLLNSFTGLAVASTGFVLHNPALIISGTLVGASGTLLTLMMCKAMNRSLTNVLFAGVGAGPATGATGAAGGAQRSVREIGSEDAAVLLANIRSLIIVPGYGMAVAQAQHVVREMADMLAARGVDVKYAIHPVAGRMPGHMNVLLAEANVPYPQLFDLEQINPEFEHTDVALVIGANDVVNPGARTDTTSPIYGMPILDADKAKHVIIIKRSMNPGFAGIDNPIYYLPNTVMLFGDAKGAVTKLVEGLRSEAA
jgi:NAD(P) transhydrogenase subunit beta